MAGVCERLPAGWLSLCDRTGEAAKDLPAHIVLRLSRTFENYIKYPTISFINRYGYIG